MRPETPGFWDPGPEDPETRDSGAQDPDTQDHGTGILTPRILEMGPWDLEIATLRPRILRVGPWELNLRQRFQVSRPAPQIELTLIVKQILIIKSWDISVKKLDAPVNRPKHLPKYSYMYICIMHTNFHIVLFFHPLHLWYLGSVYRFGYHLPFH